LEGHSANEHPQLIDQVKSMKDIQNLQRIAMRLSMHLAAFAPLANPSKSDDPLSSSLFSLEQIIIEV
jgi:hypothetical protein